MKRGIPNVVMDLDNRAKKINPQLLPSARSAVLPLGELYTYLVLDGIPGCYKERSFHISYL